MSTTVKDNVCDGFGVIQSSVFTILACVFYHKFAHLGNCAFFDHFASLKL